ncbi:MAG: NADH:ubiquinone reductase (Na(+)-transporting) subunit A [Bacteroidetes bacterium GWF2_38_335]|nr:MAG: NADH:ubiquinone reductase (Na(+)-transporting) subunit A [Bacteroidetes bacterium GWF2_38_335]OFY80529.1 MAG: NADH:ubiquinone reductase (Na(+)-transporting) subunit A [Bacteroidetes bacterium RIFOXYA12_FULL_38_20]HBS85860.1 NADH:ubiquinone reductase (Na(+)-transporting) subunit A [Bacteroidales bacterium]
MSKTIKLNRGLDIRIKGQAEKVLKECRIPREYGLRPTDFPGIVPRMIVKEGDVVKAGSPVFIDKRCPEVLFSSPVSGKIKAVVRGERRKLLEIVIESDADISYENFGSGDPTKMTREQIVEKMQKSGVWSYIRQRPYGIIPVGTSIPKSIFISGFDSSPLAPDLEFILKDHVNEIKTAVEVLKKLTSGKVRIGLNTGSSGSVFDSLQGVEINRFSGKHPAGNVGVHIHHIDPVNKGESVWTVNPQDLVIIGRLFDKGIYDASRIVALTGSEVKQTGYYKTIVGASIAPIVENNIVAGNVRFISGNVLTGIQISENGFLGYGHSQITVIPEGNYHEFFGWAVPGFNKYSHTKTFLSSLIPGRKYRLDTNYHGGERAFVITGEYEKVTPMDILPQFLIKSIMVNDIEKMEKLGIYEVIEEDLALCEYVCTSKIEVQSILREGITTIIKELS